MNDFTKDELIDLIYACNVADSHDMENRYVIINKIKSMIKNYCEHSHRHTTKDSVYCEQCHKEII